MEISVKGRVVNVPSIEMDGREIFVSGNWLKIGRVKDEAWLEDGAINDPMKCIAKLKQEHLNADIFTFAQQLPNITPKFNFPMEWDNVAAIPTSDYKFWWDSLPQEARKNARRAERRGLVIREVEFNDELLQGIVGINNETPVRQGRPFWHYGKSIDVVKAEYSSFLDRSEFIGAYYDDVLIGFIKMVYMGQICSILQILCMNEHYDKRPANALLARAVKVSSDKGLKYLTYGKFIYGKNSKSSLTEFKRRNGFEQHFVPRYFIPMTYKGKIALTLKLHLGLKPLLPESLLNIARNLRSTWSKKKFLKQISY
ncbi:hypothetical protein [Methylobacter sp. S3L5C]|uniref:hypothetical protein n=1 Tax=Methylobacter sp. S3L5C TaxID=2839024 RepID=UPI001FADED5B|nr:hypothetical protein [Methylobacter sp. S3L5C]UOA10196.1 hypothetical protein KKZ03_08170 [Methylobacter sp. S3L5C]